MKKNYFMLLMAVMFTFAATAQDVLLWGGKDSKDGSFDGGLNGWTTKGLKSKDATKIANAVWTWSADATGNPGAYSSTQTLNSVSKANGAAMFNSDYLDNGGVQGAFETGNAPGPNAGELISPTIDLSAEKNGVAVVFSQSFRNYNAETYLQYSNDGGTTWSKKVALVDNDFVKANASSTVMVMRAQMPGAGGTANFKFKFVFDGNYYVWLVDDVSVVRLEEYNLRANKSFFAIPENFSTPLSQVRPMPFLNDVQNLGGKAQNATHSLSIKQGATVAFSDSLKYAPFPKDTTIENQLFKSTFTPKVKGAYTGTYNIVGAQKDYNILDNSVAFGFSVTDSTFAKERMRTRTVTPANYVDEGKDNSWALGNVFYVPKGKGFKSGTLELGLENATAVKGQTFYLSIREWEDTDGDTAINDMSELKIVGFLEYVILGTEKAPATGSVTGKLTKVKIPNFDDDSKPIQLKDDTYYVAMVEYDGSKKLLTTPTLSANDELDYGATRLAYSELELPSYATVLDLTSDQFYSGGFGSDFYPSIRWNVVPNTTGADDIKLAETSVKVGPNPTAEYVNINFNFEKNMENVDVRIVDMAGKSVMNATYDNIQTDVKTLNVNNLANGTYQMVISTNNGAITKSFVVQR